VRIRRLETPEYVTLVVNDETMPASREFLGTVDEVVLRGPSIEPTCFVEQLEDRRPHPAVRIVDADVTLRFDDDLDGAIDRLVHERISGSRFSPTRFGAG
jgi:hypothetical protein